MAKNAFINTDKRKVRAGYTGPGTRGTDRKLVAEKKNVSRQINNVSISSSGLKKRDKN